MTTLTILTTAPADPATVTEYGDALPELVRALNHVLLHHEAMEYPSDADRLIRNVALAASRFSQLIEQVSGWLQAEQAAGRIRTAGGSRFPGPAIAVGVALTDLERAEAHARMLQQALDAAAAVTSDMAAVREDGSKEGRSDG